MARKFMFLESFRSRLQCQFDELSFRRFRRLFWRNAFFGGERKLKRAWPFLVKTVNSLLNLWFLLRLQNLRSLLMILFCYLYYKKVYLIFFLVIFIQKHFFLSLTLSLPPFVSRYTAKWCSPFKVSSQREGFWYG